jgi:hypothetical protein
LGLVVMSQQRQTSISTELPAALRNMPAAMIRQARDPSGSKRRTPSSRNVALLQPASVCQSACPQPPAGMNQRTRTKSDWVTR